MLRILLFLLLSTNIAIASTVTTPYVYSTNDTVTNVKLNSNQNAITNVVNGGLDNNNANTTSGYHFFQSVGTLPTAGNQGSVYYLTSDNTLNFDTGSTFIKSVVTASNPTVNSVVFWNGSAWATGSVSSVSGNNGIMSSNVNWGNVNTLSPITAGGVTSLLGSWTSKSISTVYQAATDGFLIAVITNSAIVNYNLLTDSSNPPTTSRGDVGFAGTGNQASLMTPVKKNDYYEVTTSGASGTLSIYFISLGS